MHRKDMKNSTRTISLRFSEEKLEVLRQRAQQLDVPVTSLIKMRLFQDLSDPQFEEWQNQKQQEEYFN